MNIKLNQSPVSTKRSDNQRAALRAVTGALAALTLTMRDARKERDSCPEAVGGVVGPNEESDVHQ